MDCYPNPFNPTLTVYYNLKNDAHVNINIFDLLGNKVVNLENNIKKIGEHYSIWSGTDKYGNKVPSGIYFVKMNYDNNIITKKITLLK